MMWLVMLLFCIEVACVHNLVIQSFPNSADEYVYLIQAETYARGLLWVASPPEREFFDFIHAINDGRFYGKYPPGWPALLALGVSAGSPWIVNPLLGAANLWVMGAVAARVLGERGRWWLVGLSVINPFLVFNAASLHTHTSGLLATSIAIYGAQLGRPWVSGLGLGALLLIRPYTAAIVALPILYLLLKQCGARRALLAAVPIVAAAATLLAYNHAMTGAAWVPPSLLYDADDRPLRLPWATCLDNTRTLWLELMFWVPLAPVFFAMRPLSTPLARVSWCIVAMLAVAYFLYGHHGGNRYGPRYLHEAYLALVLLQLTHLQEWRGRLEHGLLVVMVLMNVLTAVDQGLEHRDRIAFRRTMYDQVDAMRLSNAIVCIEDDAGSMSRGDLTRNGIDFNGPVLYVHYLPQRLDALRRAFPGRDIWIWSNRRGVLSPVRTL